MQMSQVARLPDRALGPRRGRGGRAAKPPEGSSALHRASLASPAWDSAWKPLIPIQAWRMKPGECMDAWCLSLFRVLSPERNANESFLSDGTMRLQRCMIWGGGGIGGAAYCRLARGPSRPPAQYLEAGR